MKERPILFSSAMVRAILEDCKTQTRRIVKPQPVFTGASGDSYEWHGGPALERAGYGAPYVHTSEEAMTRAMESVAPFKPGDTLWVRETWQYEADLETERRFEPDRFLYRADTRVGDYGLDTFPDGSIYEDGWKPSIFMPRIASRLTLKVTEVRVQRLQEISEEDAKAEGVSWPEGVQEQNIRKWGEPQTARMGYADLWDSISGKRAPWESNPWIWAVTFERMPGGAA